MLGANSYACRDVLMNEGVVQGGGGAKWRFLGLGFKGLLPPLMVDAGPMEFVTHTMVYIVDSIRMYYYL